MTTKITPEWISLLETVYTKTIIEKSPTSEFLEEQLRALRKRLLNSGFTGKEALEIIAQVKNRVARTV